MTASSGNGAISIILIVTDGELGDELKAEHLVCILNNNNHSYYQDIVYEI